MLWLMRQQLASAGMPRYLNPTRSLSPSRIRQIALERLANSEQFGRYERLWRHHQRLGGYITVQQLVLLACSGPRSSSDVAFTRLPLPSHAQTPTRWISCLADTHTQSIFLRIPPLLDIIAAIPFPRRNGLANESPSFWGYIHRPNLLMTFWLNYSGFPTERVGFLTFKLFRLHFENGIYIF